MKRSALIGLYGRLFAVFAAALLFASGLLTYNNVVIQQISWQSLLPFNIPVIVSGSLLIALILTIVTMQRLRPVLRELKQSDEDGSRELAAMRLWRLPSELFGWMLALSLIGSLAYHAVDIMDAAANLNAGGRKRLSVIGQVMVAETLTGLTPAVLFFVLLRRLAKRYLTVLHPVRLPPDAEGTFWHPLLWTFSSCFLIVVYAVLRFLLRESGPELRVGWLIVTFFVYFLFALAVYRLLTSRLWGELRELSEGIRSLLHGKRSRLHETVPVTSNDEIGQLASAFNELQTIVAAKYESLDKELALASEMQLQLLPVSRVHTGRWTVVSRFRPAREVGGDLFDIVPLGDSRLAVLIGDVSGKGMPAALLMSAALALFRAEIQAGGTPAEIVTRLNRSLSEMLRGDMYVTLGLAIFDASDLTVRYASAGHVAPYLIGAGGVTQIPVCSLPAGIDADEAFGESSFPFHPGDRLVLYTDGVVEANDRHGDMLGFDRFERVLQDMDPVESAEAQLAWLNGQLPEEGAPDEDDRTLLLVALEQDDAAGQAM